MSQNKIYVGNLSYSTTSEDLRSYFSQYGEIEEAKVIADFKGRSKGFGFVTYNTDEAAQSSLQADGVELQGRKIRVNVAREPGEGDRRERRRPQRY